MGRKKKKRNLISEETVNDMAAFFLKEFFANIPQIPIIFAEDERGSLGSFVLEENDFYEYDKDELKDAYEYRLRYRPLWDGMGGIVLNREFSYQDPLNRPKLHIELSSTIRKCARKLTDVLRRIYKTLH